MTAVIELNNVSKQFKGFAINDLNLTIEKGFVTGFVGANGAGKSTTIKMIMNLLQPDSGTVKLFGKSYQEAEREIKSQIGFVYDANIYYEKMNLKTIKSFVSGAYDTWDEQTFEKYIDQFELPMKKSMKHFSKGMQMKASLALALAHDPKLLIMDEPTAGLDPVARRELLDLLQELMVDENRSIFFSTHITTDLERIADYIAFIDRGRLRFHQSIESLHEEYAIVKGDTALLDADIRQLFTSVHEHAHGFEALTSKRKEAEDVLNDHVLIENASLEDILYYSKGGVTHA